MSKYVPAITSHGVEEVLPLSQSDLLELQSLARFICQDLGHKPNDPHAGCCDQCFAFAARLFAFQKEA